MNNTQRDQFADIARQGIAYAGRNLVPPSPAPLPDTVMPMTEGGRHAAAPLHRMSTQHELEEALSAARRERAPYLCNLAPAIPSSRRRIPIRSCGWRKQQEADRRDFGRVLRLEGDWEPVELPHYAGPLGKKTTYYQTIFGLTAGDLAADCIFVCFGGVDYVAHVYVNGAYLGSHEGFFAPFEFDFRHVARERNQMVVVVKNDDPHSTGGEKVYAATGPGYDDPLLGWHHCPAGMGIYQKVYIETRSAVHFQDIFVRAPTLSGEAEAWVEIQNRGMRERDLNVMVEVHGQNFSEQTLAAWIYHPVTVNEVGIGDSLTEAKDRTEGTYHAPIPCRIGRMANQLRIPFRIPNPRIWSPATPWLYQIQLSLLDERGEAVDTAFRQFGIRTFEMAEQSEPKGMFSLNG